MENIFIGIVIFFIGFFYLRHIIRNRNYKDTVGWDKLMLIRGYLGGIMLLILGIFMMYDGVVFILNSK